MDLTNKQMDEAVERAEADNEYAVRHSADNSGEHVGERYCFLHGECGRAVPVRPGAITPPPGTLRPASLRSSRKGAYEWYPARGGGIIATIFDEASGELGQYRVEINGNNGVWVVGRA